MFNKKKIVNTTAYTLIYASVISVLLVLAFIIYWIFSNGLPGISMDFLTGSTNPITQNVVFEKDKEYDFEFKKETSENGEETYVIDSKNDITIENKIGKKVKISSDSQIKKIDTKEIDSFEDPKKEIESLKNPSSDTTVQITIPGDGIRELILTTLFLVFWSLLFSLPIGLCTAIYLIEYDISPRLNRIIHFAIDSLAGIPSIIFGLFGSLFFGLTLGLGQSLLAGILTVVIMLLPVVIKSIEEALISVPYSFREASYGLGATKTQTLFKIVLPSAVPGIIVAVILTIGRVIGESAIFIFVVGTAVSMPTLMGKGASLTVYVYSITREHLDISKAASVSVVIFVIILILNLIAKFIGSRVGGKR